MLILTTKLHRPDAGPQLVQRVHLLQKLQAGLDAGCRLTVVSASAGSGKTTLVSHWVAGCGRPVAWLSLDATDNEVGRLITGVIAALQTLFPQAGDRLLEALQAPQRPALPALLTALVNALAEIPQPFVLVLDDCHVLDDPQAGQALTFLAEHLPVQMHLVMASREDPALPLARLRSKGKLNEIRLSDLRFTLQEARDFLTECMGLSLTSAEVEALEHRTEGWIAGLQLAALSLQGQPDPQTRIAAFTGNHRFVLDYLLEEVLQQQTPEVQRFLLHTSILQRMCGPLCAAVMGMQAGVASGVLEHLERANLFLVPLDAEKRWYRYHHLFAGLLRQRLQHTLQHTPDHTNQSTFADLHVRASQWYEEQGLGMEAFEHACAARDLDRAEKLLLEGTIPLHLRGAVDRVLEWMASVPVPALQRRPLLSAMKASFLLVRGQTSGVAEHIQIAEDALQHAPDTPEKHNMLGQLSAMRSTLALTRYRFQEVMQHSEKALEMLSPDNLPFRAAALWGRACALGMQGEPARAGQLFQQALTFSQSVQDTFSVILCLTGLGMVQELQHQLNAASQTFWRAVQLSGDPALPNAADAHLGLAQIALQRNDLQAAQHHGEQSLMLSRQYDQAIDRFLLSEMLLVQVQMAQQDVSGAETRWLRCELAARQGFAHRLPELQALRVKLLLQQGNLDEAARHTDVLQDAQCQIAVLLAQKKAAAALELLGPLLKLLEEQGLHRTRLELTCLQVAALHLLGQQAAEQVLVSVLVQTAPEGSIRMFLEAGSPMLGLLRKVKERQSSEIQTHVQRVLDAFGEAGTAGVLQPDFSLEALSGRELQILQLVAQGLSNQQIGERLFLALDTVKGHNRNIFGKLQVKSRTEAIARARGLGLI
ncbi:LuxR C-terminal-related transcriptional regulator [Deinococcus roseus]|uniref:LuxR family transcriptional regulator n=1 Tax=Deinococcus roseus TaxID=392414 RepID=A0ABQ2D322_9DEIO|nr:LuxR C-terminal-related transcriptional regulator [Deinococcus roseus]GGJ39780.1 LuxR family transcriptional regulator [Deinococcus roseus]